MNMKINKNTKANINKNKNKNVNTDVNTNINTFYRILYIYTRTCFHIAPIMAYSDTRIDLNINILYISEFL